MIPLILQHLLAPHFKSVTKESRASYDKQKEKEAEI